jgi:hypothetical protein
VRERSVRGFMLMPRPVGVCEPCQGDAGPGIACIRPPARLPVLEAVSETPAAYPYRVVDAQGEGWLSTPPYTEQEKALDVPAPLLPVQ